MLSDGVSAHLLLWFSFNSQVIIQNGSATAPGVLRQGLHSKDIEENTAAHTPHLTHSTEPLMIKSITRAFSALAFTAA